MELKTVTAGERRNYLHPPMYFVRAIVFPMNWWWKGSDD